MKGFTVSPRLRVPIARQESRAETRKQRGLMCFCL